MGKISTTFGWVLLAWAGLSCTFVFGRFQVTAVRQFVNYMLSTSCVQSGESFMETCDCTYRCVIVEAEIQKQLCIWRELMGYSKLHFTFRNFKVLCFKSLITW